MKFKLDRSPLVRPLQLSNYGLFCSFLCALRSRLSLRDSNLSIRVCLSEPGFSFADL